MTGKHCYTHWRQLVRPTTDRCWKGSLWVWFPIELNGSSARNTTSGDTSSGRLSNKKHECRRVPTYSNSYYLYLVWAVLWLKKRKDRIIFFFSARFETRETTFLASSIKLDRNFSSWLDGDVEDQDTASDEEDGLEQDEDEESIPR